MTQSFVPLDKVTIRPFHPGDAENQHGIVSHPRMVEMLPLLPSMELAETEQWAKEEKTGRHRLVADWHGRLLGTVQLTQNMRPRLIHSGRVELMVHPDFWGQGVGSQLFAAALDVADNWLNLSRLELKAYAHNRRAVQLCEKFGFAIEGKRQKVVFGNGRYLDDYVMARLHGQFPGPSQPAKAPEPPPPADFSPEEVIIRPPHPSDTEALYASFSHPLVARTTLQMPTQEIGQTRKRLETQNQNLYRFVAEVQGTAVGMSTLYQLENPRLAHTAGLGMMVHPAYWGKGVGSRLMTAVIDLADNWLNIRRVELEVNVDNPAGVRLYHRFGFEIEGTKRWHAFGDGRMADSHFMARVR